MKIKWKGHPSVKKVKILYILNGENTPVAKETTNDGEYIWDIPKTLSGTIALKLYEDNLRYFTYVKFINIKEIVNNIFSPNSKTSLKSGQEIEIKWAMDDKVTKVKILYKKDGNWTEITSSTTNDGSYLWEVPKKAIGTIQIRISDKDGDLKITGDPFKVLDEKKPAPKVEAMDDTTVTAEAEFSIHADGSYKSGKIEKYFWAFDGKNFNDSTKQNEIDKSFNKAGTKTILVKVRSDDDIYSKSDTVVITVKPKAVKPNDKPNPPSVTIMDSATFLINKEISITAVGNDSDGSVERYYWALNGREFSDSTSTGTIKYTWKKAGIYLIKVKVRDNDGEYSSPDSVSLKILEKPEPPPVFSGTLIFLRENTLYRLSPNGQSSDTLIKRDAIEHFSISGDGSRIGFSSKGTLYMMDADGENLKSTNLKVGYFDLNLSGKKFTYVEDDTIKVHVFDQGPYSLASTNQSSRANPQWSYTDTRIGFFWDGGEEGNFSKYNTNNYLREVDYANHSKIVYAATWKTETLPDFKYYGDNIFVYETKPNANGSFFDVKANSGKSKYFPKGTPILSPDSKQILIVYQDSIQLINAATGKKDFTSDLWKDCLFDWGGESDMTTRTPPRVIRSWSQPSNKAITISWNKTANTSSYEVFYGKEDVFDRDKDNYNLKSLTKTTDTTYTGKNLANGDFYYFAITSINNAGKSGLSTPIQQAAWNPAKAPNKPSIATEWSLERGVQWTQVPGAVQYKIYGQAFQDSIYFLDSTISTSYKDWEKIKATCGTNSYSIYYLYVEAVSAKNIVGVRSDRKGVALF